jgi:hypothetical protein
MGFDPVQSFSENSGVRGDSNSQSGNSLGSVGVHSLTLFCNPMSMKCDSQAHSWSTPMQALALVVNPRLRLRHVESKHVGLEDVGTMGC